MSSESTNDKASKTKTSSSTPFPPLRGKDGMGGLSKARIALLSLTLVYAIFAFWGLGDVEPWGDEGIMALGANRVVHYGYPKAWDGKNLFSFEAGHDLSDNLLQRHLPWLGFYVGAIGQFLFGENNFGARFGFTLCGILNLPLAYWVARLLGMSRRVSMLGVIILTSLPAYFLYIRQSYHYSADVTLCLLALAFYLRIEKKWNPVLLALCTVALFHLNHLTAMWMALALTLDSIWDRKFITLFKRPSVWAAFFLAFVGTYSWIRWASTFEFQDSLGGWKTLFPHLTRLGFVLSELDMSFPLLITVPLWIGYKFFNRSNEVYSRIFKFSVCLFISFLYFGSYEYGWLRFFVFLFVVFAWIWAMILHHLYVKSPWLGICAGFLLLITTLPYHISHWSIGKLWPHFNRYAMQRLPPDEKASTLERYFYSYTNPILIEVPSELSTPPITPMNEIIAYLHKNAKEGDKIVSLCDSETLQFRTKLITAYLVDPRQESYRKLAHLPSYVSSYKDADWLLLRREWKRNYGMKDVPEDDQNKIILSHFALSGATLEKIPLRVRERFPNQFPMLWGHTWTTDYGFATMQLYRVTKKKD